MYHTDQIISKASEEIGTIIKDKIIYGALKDTVKNMVDDVTKKFEHDYRTQELWGHFSAMMEHLKILESKINRLEKIIKK